MTVRNKVSNALSSTLGISDIRSGVRNFHHGRGLLKIGEGLAKLVGTAMLAEDLLVSPFVGGRSLLMRGARRAAPSLEGNSLLAEGVPRALGYSGRRGYELLATEDVEMGPMLTPMQHFARRESDRLGLSRHGLHMTEGEAALFAPRRTDEHFNLTDRLLEDMQDTLVHQQLRSAVNSYGMVPGALEDDALTVRRVIDRRLVNNGGFNMRRYVRDYNVLDLGENSVSFNEPIGRQFPNFGLTRQHRLGEVGRNAYREVQDATPELQNLMNVVRRGPADLQLEGAGQALRNLTSRDVTYGVRIFQNTIPLTLKTAAITTAFGYPTYALLKFAVEDMRANVRINQTMKKQQQNES